MSLLSSKLEMLDMIQRMQIEIVFINMDVKIFSFSESFNFESDPHIVEIKNSTIGR